MKLEKTAIILAAGRGSRLKEMTNDLPKPMVEINNKSIISNLTEQLIDEGIDHIVVLIGYMADTLIKHLEGYKNKVKITFIENEIYDTTNNIYTLWLAKEYLKNGFYLFEADIFCEKEIIKKLLHNQQENVILVDKFTNLMNGTVIANETGSEKVQNMFLKKEQGVNFDYSISYKTVNFYKIGKEFTELFFLKELENHINKKDINSYYELIIKEAIDSGYEFHSLRTQKLKWWEIDNQEDLEIARKIFA